jgi:hypothetical protein
MNMTPTCVCDEGFVAIGSLSAEGVRQTTCTQPLEPVPSAFYEVRLPALPAGMPGGRIVDTPEGGTTAPFEETGTSGGGGCTVSRAGSSTGAGAAALGLGFVLASVWAARRRRRNGAR